MLDLHEAMRGLRFAPEALAVLDANRQVRVISRQAERLFGVPAAEIVGRTTTHLWASDARLTFTLALNEAAQRIGHADTAAPVIRRLKTDRTTVDMSVAAWHPTDDPMYATSKSPKNTLPAPRTIMIHECFYTISLRDIAAPRRTSRRSRKLLDHKAYLEIPTPSPTEDGGSPSVDFSPSLSPLVYSVPSQVISPPTSISPSSLSIPHRSAPSPTFSRSSSSPPPASLIDMLRDGVMDAIDTGVMALSVDGTVAVRNQKWLDITGGGEVGYFDLSRHSPAGSDHGSSSPPRIDFAAFVLSQIPTWHPSFILADVDFTSRLEPVDHPLYQAAVLGQVVAETQCGAIRLEGEAHYIQPQPKGLDNHAMELDENTFAPRPAAPTTELETPDSAEDHERSSPWDGPTADKSEIGTECARSETTGTLRAPSPTTTMSSLPNDPNLWEVGPALDTEVAAPNESSGSYFPSVSSSSSRITGVPPAAAISSSSRPVLTGIPSSPIRKPHNAELSSSGSLPRGTKLILEISARPMRDVRGELIGGVMTVRDVTQKEKERMESIHHESDMQFERVCDCLPQIAWTARPDGYVTYFNKVWYEYTGVDPLNSEGLGWQGRFHPDDMPSTSAAWSHALHTGEMYETTYRCLRKDNVYRWMVGRAVPIKDAHGGIIKWVGTCTDIHDTVEALAEPRQVAQLGIAIAILTRTVDMKVTIAEGPGVRQLKLIGSPHGSTSTTSSSRSDHSSNDALQPPNASYPSHSHSHSTSRARFMRNNTMLGRCIYEVWDASLIGPAIERAFAGERVVQEMEIEGRWFRTQCTPMREEWDVYADGGGGVVGPGAVDQEEDRRPVVGVVGVSVDITERKIAEVKLRESFAERSRLLASETAAKEASRLKSQFLANMSHEIRTPIAGVIGLSELLCDTNLNPEQRGIAENIQRSADALLTVINDILDFSTEVEMGKLDIDHIPFSLGIVILDTKKMLSFATSKKGLTFREEADLAYTGRVMGDPGRLRQVLTNLLTNSIKFTSEGSITLRAVEEFEDAETVRVRFSIEDQGVGIAESIRQRLFQPFSQADSSTARRYGGTGLGLTISKNLVELMGGHIGLESKEGQGTCAWFSIPFQKAQDEDKPSLYELSMEETIGAQSPMTPQTNNGLLGSNLVNGMAPRPSGSLQRPRQSIWVLVAEDNLINQQIALKTLRKMNFNAEAVDNGKEVLAAIERRTYDLILMDCQMPEMDGYEATLCIRQLESAEARSVPIIAMTASAIRGDKEKCLKVGMSDYLSKPVKRQALEAMLVRWLYDETYRQELSRWFSPPPQHSASLTSPYHMPTLEYE
ncbi:hypothetical protein RHS01_08259 [Rhizoctonia solani]|uniref:Uncharacterized protein n=1 Tax=Rhizoctonia solani TaxID=456999 RepID=A0A8H7M272_9AGAM|nr:hypothetical protein RHS01_08259 [Rhizoctonia solani]